jgi:hypothetical protein
MPEPKDLTPPPPERMPSGSKDRIRAELAAAAGQQDASTPDSPPQARWALPALVAAAVLTLVGGAFAISANSSDSREPGLPPAGSPSSSTAGPSASHSVPTTGTGTTVASPPTTPTTGRNTSQRRSRPPEGAGSNRKATYRTLALTEKLVVGPGGSVVSDHWFARGRKLDAVRALIFTFPDGHDVKATMRSNGDWSVAYSPTSGLLLHRNLDRIQALDPPWVSAIYTNGYVDHIPLSWPKVSCRMSRVPLHLC